MGANMLFRSPTAASTWKTISGDLTLNVDRDTLKMMGARVPPDALSRHDGQTSFSTLTTIGESPLDASDLHRQRRRAACRSRATAARRGPNITTQVPGLPAGTLRQQRAAVAARRGPRLRDVRRTLQRRLQALRVRQRRLRRDMAVDRGRLAGDLESIGFANIRRTRALLLLGHERGVHFPNDGGATLDAAEREHAERARGRPAVPAARQRARARHARARHLGAGRHRAARGADAGRDHDRTRSSCRRRTRG